MRSLESTATVLKLSNEVNKRCQVETERVLQDLDPEPVGAWDTVRGLMLQDIPMQALAGPLALAEAEAAVEVEVAAEVEVCSSGPGGRVPPLDPASQRPPLPKWRWQTWRRWLKA